MERGVEISSTEFGGDGDGADQQQQQQGHSTQDAGNDVTMEDFASIQQNYTSTSSQQAQHMQQHLQVQKEALPSLAELLRQYAFVCASIFLESDP